MKTKIMTITPALAQEWLDKYNLDNRQLRKTVVKDLVRKLKAGQWVLTHQGFAFEGPEDDPRRGDAEVRCHGLHCRACEL